VKKERKKMGRVSPNVYKILVQEADEFLMIIA